MKKAYIMKGRESFVELNNAQKNVHMPIFLGIVKEVIIKRRMACDRQTGSVRV
jgi:hypothetical protein